MEKRIAISQSNYVPWKGYFDLIASVDEFVIYDQAQFTKNDWRNRNLIKTPAGTKWLTIPVHGSTQKKINEVEISEKDWYSSHWKTIVQFYRGAKYFEEFSGRVQSMYNEATFKKLTDINLHFLMSVMSFLNISTRITRSSDYNFSGNASDKILAICKQANADIYISGPAAKQYLDESIFNPEQIKVEWIDYSGYPRYSQLYGSFEHHVSILDLIFNTGNQASRYLKFTGRS